MNPSEYGALCFRAHKPGSSCLTRLHLRSGIRFVSGFLSTRPHGPCSCLQLVVAFRRPHSGLSPPSSSPCPTHSAFATLRPPQGMGVGMRIVRRIFPGLLAPRHLICMDLMRAIKSGRSPVLLTERTSQVDEFASRLTGLVKHIVVLKSGIGVKQRRGRQ